MALAGGVRTAGGHRRATAPAFVSTLSKRWLAFALIALLAFAGQSVVTQSHVHFDADTGLTASVPLQIHGQPAHRRAPPDDPAHCPLCRNLAQAGHYLTPAAIVLVAPIAVAFWRSFARARPWHAHARSHAWRSRGPPARALS